MRIRHIRRQGDIKCGDIARHRYAATMPVIVTHLLAHTDNVHSSTRDRLGSFDKAFDLADEQQDE